MNRRALLQQSGALALLAAGFSGRARGIGASLLSANSSTANPSTFDPRSHGARGDGRSNDRRAIQDSIDECHHAGGGTVHLSPGTYLTGTIVLKSNVALYLEGGATLLGSTDMGDYLGQEGSEGAKHYSLVFARGADRVSIAGPGTINGQGESFWTRTNRVQPEPDQLWADVITKDWKPLSRPSPMVDLVECTNTNIRDVTLMNSGGRTFRHIACRSVAIQGIKIRNPIYGPNVDGIDIACCQDVSISDCDVQTADDAICLKSENPFGDPSVTRNVTVTHCTVSGCCNGLKIGTETKSGFENIVFSNCVISNNDVPFNQRIISGIAIEMVDGGWIDGVNVSGIQMQRARAPIFIRHGSRTPRSDGSAGTMKNISISGVQATGSIIASSITGVPGMPVEDVSLSGIHIENREAGKADWAHRPIPEQSEKYPEAKMFGRLPAYGLFCRHVNGIRLKDVTITGTPDEQRPGIVFDDVTGSEVVGVHLNPANRAR
jgi:polygalacturonase